MKGASLTNEQVQEYIKVQKPIYSMIIGFSKEDFGVFYFRNDYSCKRINELINDLIGKSQSLFKINNGIKQIPLKEEEFTENLLDMVSNIEVNSNTNEIHPYLSANKGMKFLNYNKTSGQSLPAFSEHLNSKQNLNDKINSNLNHLKFLIEANWTPHNNSWLNEKLYRPLNFWTKWG